MGERQASRIGELAAEAVNAFNSLLSVARHHGVCRLALGPLVVDFAPSSEGSGHKPLTPREMFEKYAFRSAR